MTRNQAERLGDGSTNAFQEMAFSIEKVAVTAVSIGVTIIADPG